jgi:hypothetical protein
MFIPAGINKQRRKRIESKGLPESVGENGFDHHSTDSAGEKQPGSRAAVLVVGID